MQGNKGEEITDNSVWVVKTHSPWAQKHVFSFFSNKVVCLVRNPLSVIKVWTDHLATNCYGHEVAINYAEQFPEWWNKSIKKITKQMADWH